jgi:hypothetical protein
MGARKIGTPDDKQRQSSFSPHAYAADTDNDTAYRLIAGHLTAFIVQVDGKDTHEHQHFRQRLNALRVIFNKQTIEGRVGNFTQRHRSAAVYSNFASGQYRSIRPIGICSMELPILKPSSGINIDNEPSVQK